MGVRTDPWWVCSTCNKKLVKVKHKKFRHAIDEHRKLCSPSAGCQIKQIKQGK